jgi:type IV pilus assembly protein PilN
MSKINLLPWREKERTAKKQEFITMVGVTAVIALGIWGLTHFFFVQKIDYQNNRNNYLISETEKLDAKITEIEELEREKQRLLDRMRAIEQLQGNRPLIVRLFDELITSLPEGVSVISISQQGQNITITGEAQSNARVSSFMRNLDDNEWLHNPQLDVIQATNATGVRISGFTLRFQQVMPNAEEEDV